MEATCSVCFDKFNKARRQVVCPACPENLDVYPCTACTQTYLLESPQAAHCMNCRHEWGQNFLYQTFPKTWLTGAYRKSRQQKSLEREKALLQETLPLVEVEKQKDAIRAEIRNLREIREDILAEIRMVDEDIRVEEQKLRDGTGVAIKATVYTFPCPVMAKNGEKCKGFIEAKTWKCGLCEERICRSCHVQLPKDADAAANAPAAKETAKSGKSKAIKKKPKKHICKEDDIATAKAIVKDTKPCPKCAARIYRTEGCSQMFCTAPNCHTAFDWNTGRIVTGIIHNPHYYELMRKMGTAQRTPGDVPCGGLPAFFTLDVLIKTIGPGLGDDITKIHRLAGEIGDLIVHRREDAGQGHNRDLERLRLWFLMGRIRSDEEFKRQIFLCERAQQKKREELNILETFHTATIEAFNDLRGVCADIDAKFDAAKAKSKVPRKKQIDVVMEKTNAAVTMIENVGTVIEFCNKAFVDNFKAMGYRSFPSMMLGYRYPYKPNGRREQARVLDEDMFEDSD